jgi:Domain of unknown function (DUF4351)
MPILTIESNCPIDRLTKVRSRVNSLTIDRLESLGEDLLDFTSIADLEGWLSQN